MHILLQNMTDMSVSDQLRRNILLGKNSEVFSLLQNINPCLWVDDDKSTLLHYAVQYENKILAKQLIDLKVNIDAKNNKGETPLMIAVKRDYSELVYILLENNAGMCIPNAQGKCLLGRALNERDEEIGNTIRQLLLDNMTKESALKSPYIRSKTFHDDCPLYNYKLLKNYYLTKILLQSGSPVNASHPISKRTAIHESAKRLDVEMVKLLVEYNVDVNAKDFYRKSPIGLICDYEEDENMLEIMKILINAGADLLDNNFIQMLSSGSRQFVRMIFETNANLYIEDRNSKMIIDYIFENRNIGVVNELKNFKINLKVCSSDKKTLLHHAASKGNSSLLRFLLDQGLDVNAKDCNDLTPLHMAVDCMSVLGDRKSEENRRNRLSCIDLLLEKGADPQIFTKTVGNRSNVFYVSIRLYDILTELWTSPAIQLALDEASGRKIEQSVLNQIEKFPRVKDIFASSQQQLEEMKKMKIGDSITLLEFMTVKRIAIYAQDVQLMSNLSKIVKEYNSNSLYDRRLQQRFLKFSRVVAINEIFVKYYNVLAIDIAEKIVNYS